NTAQMEQVLLNLIINARDAMPDGGRIHLDTAVVTLDADFLDSQPGFEPGEYVMFSVKDQGTGMTSEVQDRIFEPFFTTKERGKGTGLGLATCYGIVKQNRGHIFVSSELNQGATFKVYLPRAEGMMEVSPHLPADSLPKGTETILIVDD